MHREQEAFRIGVEDRVVEFLTDLAEEAYFAENDLQQYSSRRLGSSDEIAKAVVFLAADNSYITGPELYVDGGFAQG